MEGLQHFFFRPIFIPGHIQRQKAEQLPGGAHVVGLPHIGGHKGEHLLLQKADVSLPVPGGHAVFQLGQQLPQLVSPAGGHGVCHTRQIAQQVPLNVAGGRPVAVAFQELEDIPPHPLGVRPGVGVPEHGKQGSAKAGPRLHLPAEEIQQLGLVHFQQLHHLGHLIRDALAHAGGDHCPLPEYQLGQGLPRALAPAQLLDKVLEIGVVADLFPRLARVLLLGAVVRPRHPVQVGNVLHLVITGGNWDITVDIRIVITRYRVGCSQKVRHFFTPLR